MKLILIPNKKAFFAIHFLLLFLPFFSSAQTPGGVSGSRLWLRADAGTQDVVYKNVPATSRTASSSVGGYPPDSSILSSSTTWAANNLAAGEYLTLDLGSAQSVQGLSTKGMGNYTEWVTQYTVSYSNDNVTYTPVGITFNGNADQTTEVYNFFASAITARYFRIITVAYYVRPAMRADLITTSADNTNGAAITAWNDQSGNANHVSQSITGNKPAYSNTATDLVNYNSTLKLNGSTQYFVNACGIIKANTYNNASAFVVAKTAAIQNGSAFYETMGTGFQFNMHIPWSDGNVYWDGALSSRISAAWGGTTGTPYIWTGFNNQTATPTNRVEIRRDGLVLNSSTTAPASYTGNNSPMYIGNTINTANALYDGNINEIIIYTSQLSAAQREQIESYLAIKYGKTLDQTTATNYLNASGGTIWNASTNTAYNNNIIGIGRDDSTALYQKQSHQLDDSTRIYLSTLNASNQGNGATFSSNGQFVMMGNNGQALSNTGNTQYPAGIAGRLGREWQVTNTGFTGTFSMDIKLASACTISTSDLCLIVGSASNLTTGTAYSSTNGLTFSYSGNTVTIAGITTSMLASNSTNYLTLASDNNGGTPSSAQTILTGTTPGANLTLSGTTGSVTKWQYSIDNFVSDVHDIASSASTTLTTSQIGSLAVNTYYRVVVQNGLCATVNSSSVLISVTVAPGGVLNGLYLWVRADSSVTRSGNNVSQWNNQVLTTSMTAQPSKTATPHVAINDSSYNYNPTLVYDGTSGEYLTGQYTTAPTTNPALLFVVVNASSSANNIGDPFALSSSTGLSYYQNTYGIDGSGFISPQTASPVISLPAVARATYKSVTSAVNSYVTLNGTNSAGGTSGSENTPDGNFEIGGRTWGGYTTRIFGGNIAEVLHYNASSGSPLGATDTAKIESYLAMKYAITLTNNYLSSSGTTVYNVSSYGNNIIGIARDDNSGLLQRQSHQNDDSTRIYLSALVSKNANNTGTFSSNSQFVMIGNNLGSLSAYSSSNQFPSGQGIYSRIDREWKVTNTNFSGSFNMDVRLNTTPVLASNLAIVVGSSSNLSSGTLYHPTVTYSSGTVTITGITTSMVPANGTAYMTIVSMNSSTPLPLGLISFTAVAKSNSLVSLNWQVALEDSGAIFTVERSADGSQWKAIGTVSTAIKPGQYSFGDNAPLTGISYYRLGQTDAGGKYSLSAVRSVDIAANGSSALIIYPNPASDQVTAQGDMNPAAGFTVFDASGRNLTNNVKIVISGSSKAVINLAQLATGMYIIKCGNSAATVWKK